MRAIQTRSRNGAEVVSFGNRSFKDLFPIPVSCHHALEKWRACVCRRDLLFKLIFLIATLPKSLQCWVVSRPRNQLLHGSLRSDKPGVRQDEELEPRLNNGQFGVASPLARFGPLRFCLWVFLKPRVYINHQRTLQDLKANIGGEIAIIPAVISYD
jgi:hypothetical protein